MKCLIQRVKNASCTIDGKLYSSINAGILALVGIEKGDTIEQVEWMAKKVVNLRIFEDENEKMNKSLIDINGEMLIVSQFTLCGDCKKGTRPSFDKSEKPELANKLYDIGAEYGITAADKVRIERFFSEKLQRAYNT